MKRCLEEREAVMTVTYFHLTYFMPLHLTWSSRGGNTWNTFKEYMIYSLIPWTSAVMVALEAVAQSVDACIIVFHRTSTAVSGLCFLRYSYDYYQNLLSW